jgi:hypothetical protein
VAISESGNTIGGPGAGEGNVIAHNNGVGVEIDTGTGNSIRGNSIHSNALDGIGLFSGGNGGLAAPVITAVGSASGTACANCIVDVYSDDANEGRVYHGSAVADDNGNGTGDWSFPDAVVGPNVTATATNPGGNTSQFSAPVCLDGDQDTVCNVADNCPAWPNAAQDLPPWTVPADDGDCDGFSMTREQYLGTDPAKHCAATATANDERGPAFGEPLSPWPSDFNDNQFTTLQDVILMGPAYNLATGGDPARQRFDLSANGFVTLQDVILMGPFYNKGCG